MLVKDLKVGAMYRLQSLDGSPQNINFGYYPDYEDCMVSLFFGGGGLGDKFVYLGIKTLEYKKGSYNRRHKKNTWRLGLFGDKVLPIAPDIWAYIEPMEET
jgi:hypothetical protein